MDNLRQPQSWNTIENSIKNGHCIGITDGSYNLESNLATSCWHIVNPSTYKTGELKN